AGAGKYEVSKAGKQHGAAAKFASTDSAEKVIGKWC
ncbi:unnamed protein product, partial [Rotaria magnacalcarata]